jgi:cytochrome c biogenesis factor
LTAYIKYIGKTLWPTDLAVFYPYTPGAPLWQVVGSLAILLLMSVTAIRTRRSHPYFAVGWAWFIITLVPVIGIIQVGGQSMADRYSYVPIIGIFIIVAWGVPNLTKRWRRQGCVLALLAGIVIITSTILTWRQLQYWRDDLSMFQHAVQVTTDNYLAHYNLGIVFEINGDANAAIHEFQETLLIRPNDMKAKTHLSFWLDFKNSHEK